jgi:menaquinone-dependent protoporphyrinogen oxidase
VALADAADPPPGLSVDGYEAVVVGAPLRRLKYPRAIAAFVRAHRARLDRMPSAFFSVCLAAASPIEAERRAAETWPERLFRASGWRPRLTATFAGALRYRRYNPLLRWLMKQIARSKGASTDTSRDHEYTDWQAVTRFAEALEKATAVPAPSPA